MKRLFLLILLFLTPTLVFADGVGVISYKTDCSAEIEKGKVCCNSSTGVCYFGTGSAVKTIIQEDSSIDGTIVSLSNIPATALKWCSAPVDEQCGTYEETGNCWEPVVCGNPSSLVQICKTMPDPINGETSLPYGIAGGAWTITDITYFCSGGTSVTFTLQENDNQGANPVAIEAIITCTSGNAVAHVTGGDIDNAGVDADDILNVLVGTVTGTVDYLTICFTPSL